MSLRSRLLLSALALLALGLSALLFLLANDTRRWRDGLAVGDARFAGGGVGRWTADADVPFGAGRWLLGIGDDLAFRDALGSYRRRSDGSATYGGGYQRVQSRGRAEAALARIEQDDTDPRRASRAATLLGVMAYSDPAVAGRAGAPSPRDTTLAEFRNALRLDPTNDAAKADLELTLLTRGLEGSRSGKLAGGGVSSGGNRGAGYGAPGRGY